MKKLLVALASLSLILAPVAITGATAKPGSDKAKCSASDVRSQNALDALAKVAKAKLDKATKKATKVKSEHKKAQIELKKAREGKAKKVKTLAELNAKLVKINDRITAQNLIITTATGEALVKAQSTLTNLNKEAARLNASIAKATAEATAAEVVVETVTETVTEAEVEIEEATEEVEVAEEEEAEKVADLNVAKAKCKK